MGGNRRRPRAREAVCLQVSFLLEQMGLFLVCCPCAPDRLCNAYPTLKGKGVFAATLNFSNLDVIYCI